MRVAAALHSAPGHVLSVAGVTGGRQPDDIRTLVRACADGDPAARRTFQERWATDIYNFPVKLYGVAPEHAADFYVYVFERDRVFARVRTFEGRNGAQFRTFLAYYVLKSLFAEWQRGRRELDTVSLSEPVGDAEGDRTLEDVLPAPATEREDVASDGPAAALWSALTPEERLDLKLLSLLECDMTNDDVRLLARLSKRTVADTTAEIADVQRSLRAKDERVGELARELDACWGWIVLRRRELERVEDQLRLLAAGGAVAERRRLAERHDELVEAVAKRTRQRERLVDELRGFKITTPYKDIARLLNTSVGTVCSRIFRLRERLERRWQAEEATS